MEKELRETRFMYPILVSWISFLIPPDIVPGRMTLLITVFLVLVNIFNTITTNIPKVRMAINKYL